MREKREVDSLAVHARIRDWLKWLPKYSAISTTSTLLNSIFSEIIVIRLSDWRLQIHKSCSIFTSQIFLDKHFNGMRIA